MRGGHSARRHLWPRARDGPPLVRAVIALVVTFDLSFAPDQIGAILAVTAVVLGLITRTG